MFNLLVTPLMPYMKFAAPVMALLASRYKHWDLSVLSTGSVALPLRHQIPCSESQGCARVRSMGGLSLVLCFEGAFPPFSLSFHMFQESQWAFLVSLSSNPLCFGESLVMLMACLEDWSVMLRNTFSI